MFSVFYLKTDLMQSILGCVFVTEGNILKCNRTVLHCPAVFCFRKRLSVQDPIDSFQGIRNNHLVFTCEHDLVQSYRDDRCDNDIKQQVQKVCITRRKEKRSRDQHGKYRIDDGRIKYHRHTQIFGVRDRPFLIILDGSLKTFERKYRLSECLYNRDSSDIFHCFTGHFLKRILIFFHLLLHLFTGHGAHDQECCNNRDQTQKPQPPVKNEKQDKKSDWCRISPCLVRKLMCQISFSRCTGFIDDLADLTASLAVHESHRQSHDMMHHLRTHFCLYVKRCNMRTHQ